jgi:hypothetical protein
MLSLLFLLRTLSASFRRPGFLALCLASAGLATLANFTFLNYYLALASVLLLLIAANRLPVFRAEGSAPSPQPLAANLLVLAGVTCALFAVVLPMIIRLKEAGEFYYGGDRGFFRDTVISLVQASRYNLILSQAVENSIGKLAVIIVLGALLISLGLCVRTRIESRSRALFCLAAITLVAALGTIAQNSLLGVKYPTDRTAILFVPLFVLAFISGIEAGARIWPRRPVQVAAFIILAQADSAMAADCAHAFNFRFTAHWRYDADTREMLKDLAARHSFSASHSPIQLGVSWYLEPAINYYAATEKASWLEKVTRASVTEGEYDFYYVSEEDYRLLAKRNLTLLRRYDVSGNILLENRTNQN